MIFTSGFSGPFKQPTESRVENAGTVSPIQCSEWDRHTQRRVGQSDSHVHRTHIHSEQSRFDSGNLSVHLSQLLWRKKWHYNTDNELIPKL